ncbi:MAG: guanylate kinase [Candidatus Cloacimonetes bacterium HGW-Cloacimonetes-1]|jgi:guanylate kinase|nr:MAG: guanylate kinase [Candidatus Cloacimonetes bacterium HGW-Cloacimonetes-1]
MIEHNKQFLIILSAPSGGGKTTILNEVRRMTDNIDYSVSYTTRQPRGTEENKIHYHFVDEPEFLLRKEAGDFLESALVFGKWYGTSISFIKGRLEAGKHVIMDIDVQGAALISSTDIPYVKVFIVPPSMDILKDRLIKRDTDSMEEIEKRLKIAITELEHIDRYDYLVINDDLETAVRDVISIVRAEENRTDKYINPIAGFLCTGENHDQ